MFFFYCKDIPVYAGVVQVYNKPIYTRDMLYQLNDVWYIKTKHGYIEPSVRTIEKTEINQSFSKYMYTMYFEGNLLPFSTFIDSSRLLLQDDAYFLSVKMKEFFYFQNCNKELCDLHENIPPYFINRSKENNQYKEIEGYPFTMFTHGKEILFPLN